MSRTRSSDNWRSSSWRSTSTTRYGCLCCGNLSGLLIVSRLLHDWSDSTREVRSPTGPTHSGSLGCRLRQGQREDPGSADSFDQDHLGLAKGAQGHCSSHNARLWWGNCVPLIEFLTLVCSWFTNSSKWVPPPQHSSLCLIELPGTLARSSTWSAALTASKPGRFLFSTLSFPFSYCMSFFGFR